MKTIKTLGDIACISLACIAVVIICFFVYYLIFNEDITVGVNNIGDQIAVDIVKDEDLTEEEKSEYEERYFMTANYYDNANKNGVELQELRFDYFMTYNLKQEDYRSTGMQFLGNYKHTAIEVDSGDEADRHIFNEFYYYDTTNGISWSGYNGNGSIATKLNRNQVLIIKIDNRPFAIQLTGQYDIYGKFLGFLWQTKVGTYYYSYPEIFECVFQAIRSNNRGYGDYYITVDLSDFFSIREYAPKSGQYKADDVTDIIKNYAVLKFHYEANGAKASSQSLFGSIECNLKYDIDKDDYDTTYWQERIVYNLTEKDLSLRYSDFYEGSFASLPLSMKELFSKMGRVKVNITLNLSDTNIIGFDFNAFENLEIDTIRITGKRSTFYLLDKCLYDTKLARLERGADITLDFAENAINSEYAEVVL